MVRVPFNNNVHIYCTICGKRLHEWQIDKVCPRCHGDIHYDDISYAIEQSVKKHKKEAEAILDDLGLGWLPYPENKPTENNAYLVTAYNPQDPDNTWTEFDTYDFDADRWDGIYVIAFKRERPTPYQPEEE